jgi:hypothetical protein
MLQTLCDRSVHLAADPAAAWKLARRLAREDDLICATGSFFLAAGVREIALDERTTAASPAVGAAAATSPLL